MWFKRRGLPRHPPPDEVEVLFREYENLRSEIRSLAQGGYTIGLIAAALGVGIFTASLEFARRELVLVLPAVILFAAASVGMLFSALTYIGRHLANVERRINERYASSDGPLLTWESEFTMGRLPSNPFHNPFAGWQLIIALPTTAIYVAAATIGSFVAFDLMAEMPEGLEFLETRLYRYLATSLYATGHVLLGVALIALYLFSNNLIEAIFSSTKLTTDKNSLRQ